MKSNRYTSYNYHRHRLLILLSDSFRLFIVTSFFLCDGIYSQELEVSSATCTMTSGSGTGLAYGTIQLTQPNGFTANSNSSHGFHVHQNPDLSAKCNASGSHLDVDSTPHGAPWNTVTNRHTGDLGNVNLTDRNGNIQTTILDSIISLSGPRSVIGRSIVIHSLPDDLGLGDPPDSITTGNSGSRLGCCLIQADPVPSTASSLHSTSLTSSNFAITEQTSASPQLTGPTSPSAQLTGQTSPSAQSTGTTNPSSRLTEPTNHTSGLTNTPSILTTTNPTTITSNSDSLSTKSSTSFVGHQITYYIVIGYLLFVR